MQLTFPLALFLVFLTLKLMGVIVWSWLWVTAPLWAGIAVCAVVFVFCLVAVLLKRKVMP